MIINDKKISRIVHVDINSYFATMLQQENPALRGKSVGVLKSTGRTCLIAASKEAKLKGIKTGCRLIDARRLDPNIILVPAAFNMYLDCTKRLKNIFVNLAPEVDIFSLDEAFLDITSCNKFYPDVSKFGQLVQQKIKEELGEWVTCNVGVSHTRLLAKLASECGARGEVTIIGDDWPTWLASVPLGEICGIGWRLERKLRGLGINNLYEVNFWSWEELVSRLGEWWATDILAMARGEDSTVLRRAAAQAQLSAPPMKSVGRTITGYQPCSDPVAIKQTFHNLIIEVSHKARQMNMAGRYVSIFARGHSNFWHSHRTLTYYVQHTSDLLHIMYHQLFVPAQINWPIIQFGVMLGKLESLASLQPSLLPNAAKQAFVEQAMDKINNKFGLFTIRPANLLNSHLIRPEVTGYLGDKQFYGL